MHWYYLTDRQERVPVTEEQLLPLASGGVIRPNTLVWREGLAAWSTCGEVRPDLFAPPVSSAQQAAAGDAAMLLASRALADYSPWMGVFSAVLLVSGGLVMACTAALATGWIFDLGWFREMMRQVTTDGTVLPSHGWPALAGGVILSLCLLIPGSMLAVAAGQVKRAARRGDGSVLSASLRNLGRFFQWWIVGLFLLTVLTASWSLYHWRDKALPKPPDPAAQRVAV
jgi:hypothetical protein